MSYFDNNWMNIREKWTLYERNKVRTFGHKTTNVIESYHQKVKKNLHANISFSDCLKEVLSWNSNKHLQLHHEAYLQKMTVRYRHDDNSDLSDIIQSVASPKAADEIIKQVAMSKLSGYKMVKVDKIVHQISLADKTYEVHYSHDSVRCSCSFNVTMTLPCRHIFIVDGSQEEGSKFNEEWLPQRWRKERQLLLTEKSELARKTSVRIEKVRKESLKTRREKYNELIKITKELADLCAREGHKEFCNRYEQLSMLHLGWKEGRRVQISIKDAKPISSNEEDHGYTNNPSTDIDESCMLTSLEKCHISDEHRSSENPSEASNIPLEETSVSDIRSATASVITPIDNDVTDLTIADKPSGTNDQVRESEENSFL